MTENKSSFKIETIQLRSFKGTKSTFALKTIPNECGSTRAFVWALSINATGIRMTFFRLQRMSLTAFVNVWKIMYILRQDQAAINVITS